MQPNQDLDDVSEVLSPINTNDKTADWLTPKCGGKSHLYGVFMGRGTLDSTYMLKKRAMFKTSFQIRGPKAIQTTPKVLFDLKTDDTKIKI